MTCVYPMNGRYALLNRVLYYALVILCATDWGHVWAVVAAMAYILNYSATASVHALLLDASSAHRVTDLDALGAWAVVSIAALAVLPIYTVSARIRESKFSVVFVLWGVVLGVGCVSCWVALNLRKQLEVPCVSESTGELLTTPAQLTRPGADFNCSYDCFGTSQIMRSPSDMLATQGIVFSIFKPDAMLALEGLVGSLGSIAVGLAVFGCCWTRAKKRTQEDFKAAAQKIGMTFPYLTARPDAPRRRLLTGEYLADEETCDGCWSHISAYALIVVIVVNEVLIFAHLDGTLVPAKPREIDQWGSWVGVGLALVAAFIMRRHESAWERKREMWRMETERSAAELRASNSAALLARSIPSPLVSAGTQNAEAPSTHGDAQTTEKMRNSKTTLATAAESGFMQSEEGAPGGPESCSHHSVGVICEGNDRKSAEKKGIEEKSL